MVLGSGPFGSCELGHGTSMDRTCFASPTMACQVGIWGVWWTGQRLGVFVVCQLDTVLLDTEDAKMHFNTRQGIKKK